MINKVTLIGRIGNKPQLKEGKTGTKYAQFSLATNSGYGEKKTTDWHDVTCFNKTAEAACAYIEKGNLVYIEGRIQYDVYEKDGKKQKSTKIIADLVRNLSPRQDQSGQTDTQNDPQQYQQEIPPMDDNPFIDDIGDVPF